MAQGDTSPAIRRLVVETLRSMPRERRLELAAAMSDEARRVTEDGIRHRRPGASDPEVRAELVRVLRR